MNHRWHNRGERVIPYFGIIKMFSLFRTLDSSCLITLIELICNFYSYCQTMYIYLSPDSSLMSDSVVVCCHRAEAGKMRDALLGLFCIFSIRYMIKPS